MEPLRDEDDDDDVDENDDEDSSPSGTSPTLARFSGETSLSDSEAEDTSKHRLLLLVCQSLVCFILHVLYFSQKHECLDTLLMKSGARY